MKRFCKLCLAITCFLFLFPGSAFLQAKEVREPLHEVTLQLQWFHQFQFAGFYAAKEKEFYREEGLDVEIKQGGYKIHTVDEVMDGRAQFGVTNSEILLSRLKDKKKVVVLASIFQHSPLVFITRKETNIAHPQDFIGKKIQFTRQIRDLELHTMLFNEGVGFDQFDLVDGPGKIEYLFDKSIDVLSVYITNEPYYYMEKGIEFNVIRPSSYGVDFYGDNIFSSEKYVTKYPGRVAAFKRASLKGWEYAMANKDEIIDLILEKYNRVKARSHLEYEANAMYKLILPDLISIGHTNPGRWNHIADVFVQQGVLNKDYSLDGFIFNPGPAKNNFRIYLIIAVLAGVVVLFFFISITLYVFNNRLNLEVKAREKSQKALAQSEARLTSMFENIHSGVIVYKAVDQGRDFIIKGFNKTAQQIENVTLEEVLGKTVTKVFPRVRDGLFESLQRVYNTGISEQMPTSLYKNKRIIDWRENYVYRLSSGEIAVVYNDETIRKKAEISRKHLDTINHIIINSRHSEKMLNAILDAMLTIFECDRIWLVSPCDPFADSFTIRVESARDQWQGFGVSDKKIPMSPEVVNSMKKVLAADGPIVFDLKTGLGIPDLIVEKYQIKSAIRMAIYPKVDQAWMLGMHRCVSDIPWTGEEKMLFNSIGRRISDGLNTTLLIQELKKTNRTLMESDDRFVKIFHSSPVGIVITSREKLEILNINKSFLDITGFTEEQVLGNSFLKNNFIIAPESIDVIESLKQQDLFSQIDIKFFNVKNELRDGRLSSQRVSISGKLCIIITIEDVANYKEVQKEKLIAQQHAAEQEKYALIGQIAGKMAHDFNNILGSIMGNTELSLLDCQDPDIRKTFNLILKQTQRGRSLTNDLVSFAKDQEPRQDFFNINEKIDLVLNLLKKDLESVSISKSFFEPMPDLLADPGMIENALVNIIHNAVHAMSKIATPRLTILTYSDNKKIIIEIADNGCGIPKEHQKSIYTPAFTLKNNKDSSTVYDKSITGTGYGLFNVRKIVQKHKGRIWFESDQDSGTKFSISLPVIKKELTVMEKIEVEKTNLYKSKKILIVEDEQSIADVQSLMLADTPFCHEVDVAHNGHMALDFLEKESYDLISLDYRLPGGINGMDLYNKIRKNDKEVPILFISGNIEFLESITELTRKDKRLDHLSKPCRNTEYIDCINVLFSKSLMFF